MKTNNDTAMIVNFKPLIPLIEAARKAEGTLNCALADLWNAHAGKMDPADFRRQFLTFADESGYSEDWAKELLLRAGIRIRAMRSDSGKAREHKKQDKVSKALKLIEKLELSRKELAILIATLS